MRRVLYILLLLNLSVNAQKIYKKKAYLMGVNFEFALVAKDSLRAQKGLDVAIEKTKEIENKISSWKSDSQTSAINRNAGTSPVKVDKLLYDLIERSIRISDLTRGAFDISFASVTPVWKFNGQEVKQPDSILIKKSVEKINYKNIILSPKNQTVFLKEKGMKIGFGAIGKGFTAEVIMQMWKEMGFSAGLINASGDIRTFGNHPKTDKWRIGISNPDSIEDYLAWFAIKDTGVVTSGDYENYIIMNGERYSHIIDPRTGWPVKGLKSVTIFCDNSELADALATSVFVMGRKKGIHFINQLKGIEALIVDDSNQLFYSDKLKTKYQ